MKDKDGIHNSWTIANRKRGSDNNMVSRINKNQWAEDPPPPPPLTHTQN